MKARTTTWSPAELASHSRWVHALALRLVQDAAQADDLVQETFLAALERRPRAGLRPWLGSVVRKRAAFWGRGEARRRARERDRAPAEALPSSDELAERAEVHGEVVRALTGLRDPYRSVLLLRYYEGVEPAEIARRQGVPGATVRSRIKRGLDELRAELDRRFEGDRRRWALAAVPLAARAEVSVMAASAGAKLAATAVFVVALLVAGVWMVTRSGGRAPRGAGPVAVRDAAQDEVRTADESMGVAVAVAAPSEERQPLGAPLPVAQDEATPFRAVIRDRDTGQPIPHYAIEIADEERGNELVWSDGEGRMESERGYPAGRLRVSYIDHPALDGVARYAGSLVTFGRGLGGGVRWDPESAPVELTATVGPTYRLAITAPFPWDSVALKGSLQVLEGSVHEPQPMNWQVRAPVRTQGGAWIRFQNLFGSLPLGRPWLLRIQTEDGLWGGEAEVAACEGIYPEPVAIELARRARLVVELVSAGALRNPEVTLEALASGVRFAMFGTEKRAADDRNVYGFELTALPAGDYRVLVRDEGQERVQSAVHLPAGETTRRRYELAGGPPVAHVQGELRSESGEYRERVVLHLQGPGALYMERPEWTERDGGWVAPFAFVNVAPGTYDLLVSSGKSNFRWSPYPLSVSPPTEGLVLTCRDAEPVADMEIRVRRTGGGAGTPVAYLDVEDCPPPSIGSMSSARNLVVSHYSDVPVDAALSWYVWGEGCAPRTGDESAVSFEGETMVIEVALEPGWGARVHASCSRSPLPGVEVLLDGESAGVTGPDGSLVLIRDEAPGRVDFALEGYRVDGGDYDAATGKLTGSYGMHSVPFVKRSGD